MTVKTLAGRPTAVTAPVLTLVPLGHPLLRRAVRHLGDQQELHRAVMRLFPADLPGEPDERRAAAGVLHRLDAPVRGPARLLVQRSSALRSDHADDPLLRHAELQPLIDRLANGAAVRFRVVLNAVRVQTRTGRRLAVTDPNDLLTWGKQRLGAAGLGQVEFGDRPATTLTRGKSALWTVRYDGRARIDDADATVQALVQGIGRAKAYGCGLLSIALGEG